MNTTLNFVHQHIQLAAAIITVFDGKMPLAAYLKNYFAQNKKFGSKDRKDISHFCYCYYRLGGAFATKSIAEKIQLGIFLCANQPSASLEAINKEWNELAAQPIAQKLLHLGVNSAALTAIFGWQNALSSEIDADLFTSAHLVQPDLFLRIRPNKVAAVLQKLAAQDIAFEQLDSHCLALPNASKIDAVLNIDSEVVIQDYSSQRIQELLALIPLQPRIRIWDCCAASGGKSILAVDTLKNVHLTVSDVRASILNQLQQRFARAGIKKYQSFLADLANKINHNTQKFEVVICDAPCSGSGTWGRTPEQLHFFTTNKIAQYSTLQQNIITNAIVNVAKGGYFLYITCSVFTQENEVVVAYIQATFPHLTLVQQQYFKGYALKADTLFGALFRSS